MILNYFIMLFATSAYFNINNAEALQNADGTALFLPWFILIAMHLIALASD